jgi:hypothetical protein
MGQMERNRIRRQCSSRTVSPVQEEEAEEEEEEEEEEVCM